MFHELMPWVNIQQEQNTNLVNGETKIFNAVQVALSKNFQIWLLHTYTLNFRSG